jgi:hypothetical protein
MLLQVSVQDIGQLPYFEVRQRRRPSPYSVCATSRPASARVGRATIGASRCPDRATRRPCSAASPVEETPKAGPMGLDPPSRYCLLGLLAAEAVELALVDAADERMPLVGREAENRPHRFPTVANTDLAAG